MNAAFGFRPLDFFFAVFLAAVLVVDLALLDAVFFFAVLAMLSLAPLTVHARGARSVCAAMIRDFHRIAPPKRGVFPGETR
jgi:hypothetical protein